MLQKFNLFLINNGQLGQVIEPVTHQIIVQEFQTINPRINPLDKKLFENKMKN